MTTDLSVYIHIPFCIKKCRYCSFYSAGGVDEDTKQQYAYALDAQLRSFSREFGVMPVDTLYIGGGTPLSLGVDRLVSILRTAFECFFINSDAEITVEINPSSASESDIKKLAEYGVNRFSIGLQSSDSQMLEKLGRTHTADDFLKTYESCRRYCGNVSVDLMFALPDETFDLLERDVEFVCALSPEHISLYCLTLDENTYLFRHRDRYMFASDDEQADMYMYICDAARKRGYEHYEISNFSLPGKGSRHNSKCWERYEYAGFGASAHSFFKNRRYCFENSTKEYIKRGVSESYLSFSGLYETPQISEAEAENERIMLGLRMKKGIEYKKTVPPYLINSGLAVYSDGTLSLTDAGMFVSNSVINLLLNGT